MGPLAPELCDGWTALAPQGLSLCPRFWREAKKRKKKTDGGILRASSLPANVWMPCVHPLLLCAIAQYILVAIPISLVGLVCTFILFSFYKCWSTFIRSSHWSYVHCISLNPILISRPKLACRSIGLVTFAITAIAAKFSFDSFQSTSFAIVLLLQLCSHSDYFTHFDSLSFYYWQLRQYNFFFMLRSGDFCLSRPFIVGFWFRCCHCSRLH
jgi:hypothetical protein